MRPDWLSADQVNDIYSVSGCVSSDFDDYIHDWKHNGFWLFDSPKIIHDIARENSIDLAGKTLFYYEVYEKEFDGGKWHPYGPDHQFKTEAFVAAGKQLEGFDVATFFCKNVPECSPLSCNSLAQEPPTNSHCLLKSLEDAEKNVTNGAFNDSEPGPYRIFSVYSVKRDARLSGE
ncbi:MAG: hypothetical protein ACRD40_00285 [Candidatus Acidiferrales bacterium]